MAEQANAELQAATQRLESVTGCSVLFMRGGPPPFSAAAPETPSARLHRGRALLLARPVAAALANDPRISFRTNNFGGNATNSGSSKVVGYWRDAEAARAAADAGHWSAAQREFWAIVVAMQREDYDSVQDNEAYIMDEGAWGGLWDDLSSVGLAILTATDAQLGFSSGGRGIAREVLTARLRDFQTDANSALSCYEDPPVQVVIFDDDDLRTATAPNYVLPEGAAAAAPRPAAAAAPSGDSSEEDATPEGSSDEDGDDADGAKDFAHASPDPAATRRSSRVAARRG